MHFKVNRKLFLNALQNVINVVKDNKTIPSISGIHISTSEKEIEIKGTDLENTISIKLDANVIEEGRVVFKALALNDYIKEINDDEIEFKQISNEIHVISNTSSSSYSLMDEHEYPEAMVFECKHELFVDKEKLIEGIDKTIVGAASTPDNLAVHSLRLDISEGVIRYITSDTFRLFYYKQECETNSAKIEASLPLRGANILTKILRNCTEDKVKISFSGHVLLFSIDKIKVLMKLVDLPYPDYARIIESFNSDKEVLAKEEELIKVLKRVHIFAKDNTDVRNGASFNFKDNELFISAVSDQAKINESVEVIKKGEDISISLNVKFIMDFVTQSNKDILIKLKDKNSPIMLLESNNADFLCLTMPLSLQDEY